MVARGITGVTTRGRLRQAVGRGPADRVVRVPGARLHADCELGHHVVVLMDQVVAVDHVATPVRTELDEDPDRLSLTEVGDVLGAELLVERRSAVAVQDLEVDQVDVERVEPTSTGIGQLPDLGGVQLGIG